MSTMLAHLCPVCETRKIELRTTTADAPAGIEIYECTAGHVFFVSRLPVASDPDVRAGIAWADGTVH